jgi:hypothetical protein
MQTHTHTLIHSNHDAIGAIALRVAPTVESIMAHGVTGDNHIGYVDIPPNSPYFDNDTRIDDRQMLNPGQENVVFLWGDSHARMLKQRFVQLLQDHQKNSRSKIATTSSSKKGTAQWPTIMTKAKNWMAYMPGCHVDDKADLYGKALEFFKRTRPKAIVHSINWPQYLRPGAADDVKLREYPRCCTPDYVDECTYLRYADVKKWLAQFQRDMRELSALGIRVFIATINPEGIEFDPKFMINGNTVRSPLEPVKRSAYRAKVQRLLDILEPAIRGANATMLDYSDNYCYRDSCPVVDPFGYTIFRDDNHLNPTTFVKRYLTVLDQVVEAATIYT